MSYVWKVSRADESQLARIAELIALKIRAGDTVALSGDLGAGKTSFARALIRALLADPAAEVPSPTFAIVQTYETPRLGLAHADLYRLKDSSETRELGLEEFLATGALVIEWPDRAPAIGATQRLDILLTESTDPSVRSLTLSGCDSWGPRLQRIGEMHRFLASQAQWATARIGYLQGDASARAYARLECDGARAILMDSPRQPDGPPIREGLPYSRIAHLAEDVRPFVAIAGALRKGGLSGPKIFAADLAAGLLILEDFGDRVFGREVANGASQLELWRAATEALVELRSISVPDEIAMSGGSNVTIPAQDERVLGIETELLVDWYWPVLLGVPAPAEARQSFALAWSRVIAQVIQGPSGWVLRDFHSPNLIWLPEREGVSRTGIIDFQDALQGSPAYDLVSLLQDARLDVPPDIEKVLFDHYCTLTSRREPGFDREAFSFAYAALGAQRNTKILGIFARLARRDGKPAYLAHIPRIWRYLERDLAHSGLGEVRAWYDRHLTPTLRARVLQG